MPSRFVCSGGLKSAPHNGLVRLTARDGAQRLMSYTSTAIWRRLAWVGFSWQKTELCESIEEKLESSYVDSCLPPGRHEFRCQRTKQIQAGLRPAMAIWDTGVSSFSLDALVHNWSLL